MALSPARRGDNTYSNYAEAQRAFWRQTVLPLVNRTTRAFGSWLSPAFGSVLEVRPDLDSVEALNPEREALWSRLDAASFLTEDEKRAAAGYGALSIAPSDSPAGSRPLGAKYSPDQPRVPAGSSDGGQWTDGGGGGAIGSDTIAGGSGKDKIANTSSENPRARIGHNRPPLQSGAYLGKAGAALGRYVFGPVGALIAAIVSSDDLNNDEVPGNEAGKTALGSAEVIGPYAGGKTEGVLETTEGDYYLRSGKDGPAKKMGGKGSGFDNYTKTHVEGHAAALMHQLGLTEARVYVNNPRICAPCTKLLPRMLPPGAKLEVVTPNGSQTFAGRILP